jgi:hypothetical protein
VASQAYSTSAIRNLMFCALMRVEAAMREALSK